MAKKCVYPMLGAITVLLSAASIFSPSIGIICVPIMCAIAYFLGRTVRVWILPALAVAYFLAQVLVRGVTVFSVTGPVLLATLTVPCALHDRLPFTVELFLCAFVGLVSVFAITGGCALADGVSLRSEIVRAYQKLSFDPLAYALAKRCYRGMNAQTLGYTPLVPADTLYTADVMRVYAEEISKELEGYTLWYVSGFGTFAGGVACVGAMASAQNMHDSRIPVLRDFRLSKLYLSGGVLPALVFAFLAFYPPMRPVVRSVVNVMITLPCTLCGITLVYHTVCRIPNKKARIAVQVLFYAVLAVSAFFYEWGLLVWGFIGLADCVLDVRKLLDWALN